MILKKNIKLQLWSVILRIFMKIFKPRIKGGFLHKKKSYKWLRG